jgi:hypothetical protein
MRGRVKAHALTVILALTVATGARAIEAGPARIYSDFARDGVLSCGHSEADLRAVLNDASIYQYGDPITLNGLKLAIRKQLANGCPGVAGEESVLKEGRMVLVGSALLLVTLGTGGWAVRRAFLGRK